MGGYGLYVWGSYGVVAVFLALELIFLARRKQALLERLTALREMEEDKS